MVENDEFYKKKQDLHEAKTMSWKTLKHTWKNLQSTVIIICGFIPEDDPLYMQTVIWSTDSTNIQQL